MRYDQYPVKKEEGEGKGLKHRPPHIDIILQMEKTCAGHGDRRGP